MEVPIFKKYYASKSDMDAAQRGFFDKWIQAWSQGVAMHVDGNISYLFAYATSLLTNPNFEKASELIRLADAYQYETLHVRLI